MSFCNKLGNLLRQGATQSSHATVSSMLNYLRHMSSSKLFIGGVNLVLTARFYLCPMLHSSGFYTDRTRIREPFRILDANQNGSSSTLSKDKRVEENNEKRSRNDSLQCMSVSCVEIVKSESFPFSRPWEVVEEPLRKPCDVGSMEQ